jgi:hypothetical protein
MRGSFRCRCDIIGIKGLIATLVRAARKEYASSCTIASGVNETDQYIIFSVDMKRA